MKDAEGSTSFLTAADSFTPSSNTPPTVRVDSPNVQLYGGYRFLLDSGLPTAALVDAAVHAAEWGVSLPEALIARGHIGEADYAARVAAALDVPMMTRLDVAPGPPIWQVGRHKIYRLRGVDGLDAPACVIPAVAGPREHLEALVRDLATLGLTASIAGATEIQAAVERANRVAALRVATLALRDSLPEFSAATRPPLGQLLFLVVLAGLFVGGVMVAPGYSIAAVLVALTVPFICVLLVRLAAVVMVLRDLTTSADHRSLTAGSLPTYTVMVPLFDEAEIVEDLVASLARLDYPLAKLDIILVLEEVDLATKIALLQPTFSRAFRTIVVPDSFPRTKPKALNYALQFAHGDFVVVYDAEDRPEPDQLRKAVVAFRDGPANLACVQARLNVYNPYDSWLSKQFTIEYSALFDAILPALDGLRLPLPLGGTSNHFPRAILQSIGGWDPFNVTEDADLGIRLARLGYTSQVLSSTTWEEAPVTWSQWKPQRTRWLKGWYQTYLVHTRQPLRLLKELGLWQTLGFHLFLGGIILSTLVHPIFYVLLAWTLLAADGDYAIPSLFGEPLMWPLALLTLGLSYGGAILVGSIAARRRGHHLTRAALLVPLTWLLVSFAGYRALWQLWRDPFRWEKTVHGRTRRKRPVRSRRM